jgi:membrane protein DedA with SNARE-associated domain
MVEHLLLQYGYVLVFFGSIVEGDATLLTASFLANRGYLKLSYVILTAAIASTIFNEAVFFCARRSGKPFLERQAGRHKRYHRVTEWVCRRSVLLLLFSRYIVGFRLAIPIACGAVGMRPPIFTLANSVGAVIWAVPICVVGYAFGHVLAAWWHGVRAYEWHIATALLVLLTALLAWKDPELRRVTEYFHHWRHAAVVSEARVRRLLWKLRFKPKDKRSPRFTAVQ